MDPVYPLVATPVGDGPSLVTLHASGLTSLANAKLTAAARGRYTVWPADLLGCGESPLVAGYKLRSDVDALLSLLAQMDSPAFVFGHSFGGLVALEAALLAPERFCALALFEPVAFALAAEAGTAEARAEIVDIDARMSVATNDGYATWVTGFVEWWNGPGFFEALPALQRARQLATAETAFRQAQAVKEATLSLASLATLPVTTLLLTGDRTPKAALESAALAAEVLPRGQLVRMKGVGHMGPLTHADPVNEVVLAFFDEHRGALRQG